VEKLMEFVIVANGFNRLFAWSNPIAVVCAENAERAFSKFKTKSKNYDYYHDKILEILPINEWAMVGTYVEDEGEPICSECIIADGEELTDDNKLAEEEWGPCWACLEKCRESCEYIE
jgi:hypothetical protein